jgi:Rrf2 family protein
MTGISEAANLAIHACGYIASRERRPVPSREIASDLGVSESHLRKVLQILVRKGILTSERGACGGYMLRTPPGSISLLTLLEAVNGGLPASGCLLGSPVCPRGECVFTTLSARMREMLCDQLTATSLAEFAGIAAL